MRLPSGLLGLDDTTAGLVLQAEQLLRQGAHHHQQVDARVVTDLNAAASTAGAARNPVLVLSAALEGNWPLARLRLHPALGAALESPFPWGLVANTLAADHGRPDVVVDWALRLARRRLDDRDVLSWVALALVGKGETRTAVEVGERMPNFESPEWVAAMVQAAADVSRPDLVASWLSGWAASSSDPLGMGLFDTRILELATGLLSRPASLAVVAALIHRLPPHTGPLAPEVTSWVYDLAETAGDPPLALAVLVACAGEGPSQPGAEVARAALRTHATAVRPTFAALLHTALWSLSGEPADGFRTVSLWNLPGAYDSDRAVATLHEVLQRSSPGAVGRMEPEAFAAAEVIAHEALRGEFDVGRAAEALVRCAELGIRLPEERPPDWYASQRSVTAERDEQVRAEVTGLLRAGRADLAHRLARHATFADMVGPAPASLLVDALIEGGAHGEAFQLGSELLRWFPDDAVAGLKLAVAYVWHGRHDAARALVRQAVTGRWRSVAGAAFLLQWASNVDRDAVIGACRQAVGNPRFASEADAIGSLLVQLTSEIEDAPASD